MSNIETFYPTDDDFKNLLPPFPIEITNNENIVYHGTDSSVENVIEKEGFLLENSCKEYIDIIDIIKNYEKIGWEGYNSDGYGVLNNYARYDHEVRSRNSVKPLFFTQSPHAACMYALPRSAGGETARAFRIALRDLTDFVEDLAFRKQEIYKTAKEQLSYYSAFRKYPNFPNIDRADITIATLRSVWEGLKSIDKNYARKKPEILDEYDLYKIICDSKNVIEPYLKKEQIHMHGVVFAVELRKGQYSELQSFPGGMFTNTKIGGEQIIAKSIIPPSSSIFIDTMNYRMAGTNLIFQRWNGKI